MSIVDGVAYAKKPVRAGKAPAAIAALCIGVSYGIAGAFSQILAGQGLPVTHVAVYQFLVAVIVMGAVSLLFFRERFTLREILALCLTGACNAGAAICFFVSIDLLSVGQTIAIQFQYVWMVVALQCVLERRLPNRFLVISTLLVIAGTIFGSGFVDEALLGNARGLNAMGILFAIGCAVSQALFLYFSGRVAVKHKPVPKTFFLALGALIAASIVSPDFYLHPARALSVLPGGITIGLLGFVIPTFCITFASERLPGGVVAVLSASELPVAVLAGVVMLGESVTPFTIAGVVLIIGSIVLAQLKGDFRPQAGPGTN